MVVSAGHRRACSFCEHIKEARKGEGNNKSDTPQRKEQILLWEIWLGVIEYCVVLSTFGSKCLIVMDFVNFKWLTLLGFLCC